MYIEELQCHLSHQDASDIQAEIEACQTRSYYRRHDIWLNLKDRWEAHIQYLPPQRKEPGTVDLYVYDEWGRVRSILQITLPQATRAFDPCLTFKESIPCQHLSEKTATA